MRRVSGLSRIAYLAQKYRLVLQLFRKNMLFNVLLIIPYAFILHLGSWFRPLPLVNEPKNWFFNLVFKDYIQDLSFTFIASAFLIAIQAILINRIVNKFRMNQDAQLFPGVIYILFCSFHQETINFGPVLVANLFFILALGYILDIYVKKTVPLQLFNFGLFIGLASLFYLPYYIYIFLGVVAIILLRGISFREVIQIIAGYFNVHFLLFTFLYFFESEHLFFPLEGGGYFKPYIFSFHFGSRGLFHMGMVFLMLSIVLAQYNFFQIRRSIIIQKYYDLIFWTLLISFFSMLFLDVSSISHLTLLITPISFLIGLLVTRIKNPLILETLHLIFVFSALFLQLQNW
ncbi:MAG: hypothetical protein IPP06_06375 [Saprospiraceae bacterium]|nr:hypothetical protein [Candidatus Vicinibacter affinis]MBK9960956.1 hypothetical protein [Candidatus Vicinibacter affinis]MBP6172865.1 hypothetical protein [Saprospiraceae bacterium]